MLTISELKDACERILREYGNDSKICIQIRDVGIDTLHGSYATDLFYTEDGTLFITNYDIMQAIEKQED